MWVCGCVFLLEKALLEFLYTRKSSSFELFLIKLVPPNEMKKKKRNWFYQALSERLFTQGSSPIDQSIDQPIKGHTDTFGEDHHRGGGIELSL